MKFPVLPLAVLTAGGLLGLALPEASAQTYTYLGTASTIAGQVRTPGSSDSPSAEFELPFGIAVDGSGNLYVGDQADNAVRKITSALQVTTLAGAGPTNPGNVNATGTSAQFHSPEGVAVGGNNIYVADYYNNEIRVINATSAAVSTLAGSGSPGSSDGTGSAASFSGPSGVAVDSSGNVYVTDTVNDTIRMITPSGLVTTIAGSAGQSGSTDSTGSSARFKNPGGIAVDSSGNIYVSDTGNDTIRKITLNGSIYTVTTLAGSPGSSGHSDGSGSNARFNQPIGLAVNSSSGLIFVADALNDTIRVVTTGGVVTTVAGLPLTAGSNDGSGNDARFYSPYGIAVDGSGNLYVADALNTTIRKVTIALAPPAFQAQPLDITMNAGATATFSVVASGSPTYQWYFNGGPTGTNSPILVISNVSQSNAGNYYCTINNASGNAQSQTATLAVTSSNDPGHLVNISILSNIQGQLSMGFVNGGQGTSGNEPLLIRAVGPSIGPGTSLDVQGVMPYPTLSVVPQNSQTSVASNAGWGSNAAAVTAADNATGAFPLTNTGSADSALVTSLSGGYSVIVQGASGDGGVALTEVYDDTPNYTTSDTRLVNLSCMTTIASGGSLSTGFVIGGNTAKTVLIRADGPALAGAPFNEPGTMPDPRFQVVPISNGSDIQTLNAGWGGNTQVANIANSVGAFAYSNPNSLDAATVVTLPPGAYSVQVSSSSGTAGLMLIEIYDVP